MAVGVNTNNPGNLTVSSPNSLIYPGQTGVYSANGLNYAKFATPQDGANALATYLNNNVGTDSANSLSTPNELASYYLNGSFDGLKSTSANPNASNWAATISKALGIGPNDKIPAGSTSTIAGAIQMAEGNQALGKLNYGLPGQSISDTGDNSFLTALNTFGDGVAHFLGIPTLEDKASSQGGQAAPTGQSPNNGDQAKDPISAFLDFLTNLFSINTGERVTAIIIGSGLVLVALTILISENKTVQQVAARVAV